MSESLLYSLGFGQKVYWDRWCAGTDPCVVLFVGANEFLGVKIGVPDGQVVWVPVDELSLEAAPEEDADEVGY